MNNVELIDMGEDLDDLTVEIAHEDFKSEKALNRKVCEDAFDVITNYIDNISALNFAPTGNKRVTFRASEGYMSWVSLDVEALDKVTVDLKNIADNNCVSYEDLSRLIAKNSNANFRNNAIYYPIIEYFALDLRTTPEA